MPAIRSCETTRVWTEARASSRGCIATHGLVATARAHHRLCPVFARTTSLAALRVGPFSNVGLSPSNRSKGTVQSICSELVTSSYRYGASRYVERDAYFEDSGRSTHRRCRVGSTAAALEQAPYRSGVRLPGDTSSEKNPSAILGLGIGRLHPIFGHVRSRTLVQPTPFRSALTVIRRGSRTTGSHRVHACGAVGGTVRARIG